MNKYSIAFLFFCVFVSCKKNEGDLFKNPSAQDTGIEFTNTITESNELNILDYLYFYNGGGVALGDINNDNLPDIFFSGNQVKNKLYLNKGNLEFEDITEMAGVAGNSSWNTGAVMGDVNGDGLLDIYVCAVVGLKGFDGFNELYINNGDNTFTESAAKYGLDFDSYSSNAAFLDYDLDGDLDIYILNHAVHTQESFGHANLRQKRSYQTGDKLMRNDGNKFTDVSEESGIFGGVNGYGLGIAISDFNQDGYPDIYIGNDFHEDDYYYLNNGDGTFTESIRDYFGHTTRFSMGNDVADINNDGWPDILSLDMLAEDEKTLKTSEGDDNIQIQKLRTERFGYHYQFTRNMLYLNQKNAPYSEVALQSGISATDWSWSGLFTDFDQDGWLDLFISNGIPKRPNDLDYIKFVSSNEIQKKINNTKLVDQEALELMPSGSVHNYIFKGSSNLEFIDKSKDWIVNDSIITTASAVADLDNDGDLDIVSNNINRPATIYLNKINSKHNYLKLRFNFSKTNKFGIGTKVLSYHNGQKQYRELYTVRGFQASSEPILHFGYKENKSIDSLKIIWPDKTFQVLKNVPVNQTLVVSPDSPVKFNYESLHPKSKALFKRVKNNLGIDFSHREDGYIDFNRQKLIPYQLSDKGPALAIGDLNNDGKNDIFFGGSKYKPSKIYIQKDTVYAEEEFLSIKKDSIKEDVAAIIIDLNNDEKNDLFLGSGGADFYNKMKPLLDSYYTGKESDFERAELPEYFENASVIRPNDFDNDGDIDLFIASNATSNDFGKIPNSYLLENKKGTFEIFKNEVIQNVGMVTDATWTDLNDDDIDDLIIVGEWMEPKFFINKKKAFTEVKLLNKSLFGLWQTIVPFDIDNDGDKDFLLGNWGLNTKFKASEKYPLKMYYADFDTNGSTETIVTSEKNGNYYPIASLDALTEQMVSLKKKFPLYKNYAGKTIEEIIDKKQLKNSTKFKVNILASGYLNNNDGKFEFIPFQKELQVAPITAFLNYDFDNDKKPEVLVAGNYFGVKPYHGRLDSFSGALIKSDNNVILGHKIGLDLTHKSTRHLSIITLSNKEYLLITFNNDTVHVYEINK